jgi:glucose-1-phosphate thymidylyltransferase
MKGIVLAAGYATRLYPLTKDRPKPLLMVAGRPIIDYIVDEMDTLADLDQIIVVTNHRFAAAFTEWAEARNQIGGKPIIVVDDQTTDDHNKLGAIGDIQFCVDQLKIDDELLIIAGDNLFTYRLKDAEDFFKKHQEDTILAKPMDPPEDLTRYAIVEMDAIGRVLSLEEKPQKPRSNLAVFATYFYRKETVPHIATYLKEGNSPDAPGHFPAWLYQRKPVRVYLFDGICIDIGTPESYADVQKTFKPVRR